MDTGDDENTGNGEDRGDNEDKGDDEDTKCSRICLCSVIQYILILPTLQTKCYLKLNFKGNVLE